MDSADRRRQAVVPISMIYARSRDYCIGVDGRLPWDLPDEYAHFERTTRGGVVVMGRKSYQDHQCVLPDRLNIVITRNGQIPLAQGVLRANSLSAALALAEDAGSEVFVIGGSRVFREALPMASAVYETVIEADIRGDTFVDAFDFGDWRTEILARHPVDLRHPYSFTIYLHTRT